MSVMCLASGALGVLSGWLTNNGPLMWLGAWLVLIGVGCLIARSYNTYADVALRPIRNTAEVYLHDPKDERNA